MKRAIEQLGLSFLDWIFPLLLLLPLSLFFFLLLFLLALTKPGHSLRFHSPFCQYLLLDRPSPRVCSLDWSCPQKEEEKEKEEEKRRSRSRRMLSLFLFCILLLPSLWALFADSRFTYLSYDDEEEEEVDRRTNEKDKDHDDAKLFFVLFSLLSFFSSLSLPLSVSYLPLLLLFPRFLPSLPFSLLFSFTHLSFSLIFPFSFISVCLRLRRSFFHLSLPMLSPHPPFFFSLCFITRLISLLFLVSPFFCLVVASIVLPSVSFSFSLFTSSNQSGKGCSEGGNYTSEKSEETTWSNDETDAKWEKEEEGRGGGERKKDYFLLFFPAFSFARLSCSCIHPSPSL